MLEAESLAQEGNYRKALIIYDQLLEADSKDQKALEERKKANEAQELAEEKQRVSQKLAKEKQKTVDALLSEASKLKREKKLHSALAKYNEALRLDSDAFMAKVNAEETKVAIKFEEKQTYMKNVILYDLTASYHKTFSENVAGISFKLKNKGDKTLNKVKVIVYFKDSTGTIIAEEDYYPVWVSKYSSRDNNKPLKPNYVWQLKRGMFYKAESVPSEWEEGTVSAQITNIEFE